MGYIFKNDIERYNVVACINKVTHLFLKSVEI